MHIAFDAKRAYQNGTGLGHYSRTLISSLAEYYPQHHYTLVAPKLTDRFKASDYANMSTITPEHFPEKYLKSLWRSRGISKLLTPAGIDVFHGLSHEIPMGIASTAVKSVVTMHDLIFERYPDQYRFIDRKIYKSKILYAAKHADRIIAISKQTKEDLISLYKVPEHKIDICYQSCNPIFFQKVAEAEIERIKLKYDLPEKYFLYVGSLIERKNLLSICQAMKLIENKSDVPLVVIGDGKGYKEKVKSYIRDNNLTNRVLILSDRESVKNSPQFRSAADFPAIYQGASAMIYPSFFEGFGIPVLEALSSGLPVITSNQSCLPEAGGDAAYYVDPASPQEIAAGLLEIEQNRNLREMMIQKGHIHAQKFNQQRCAEGVMNVYLKLNL